MDDDQAANKFYQAVKQERPLSTEDAMNVLGKYHADGNIDDPLVQFEMLPTPNTKVFRMSQDPPRGRLPSADRSTNRVSRYLFDSASSIWSSMSMTKDKAIDIRHYQEGPVGE